MKEKIKILFIAGTGRSGSTLLEKILSLHPEIFAAGELRYIWDRSFLENQLCSCGKNFYDCKFWQNVKETLELSLGTPLNKEYIHNIIVSNKKIDRIRYIPFLKFKKNKIEKFCNNVQTLYNSIYKISGKNIIIDSSKHVSYLYLLAKCKFIELNVIHLIREPKAVAYSWQKKKIRPEIKDKVEYMPQFSITKSSIDWVVQNLLIYRLSNDFGYFQIQYENFVKNPKYWIKEILRFLKLDESAIDSFFISKNEIYLRNNHSMAGNPIRFKNGKINIYPDEEWKKNLETKKKIYIDSITSIPKKIIFSKPNKKY